MQTRVPPQTAAAGVHICECPRRQREREITPSFPPTRASERLTGQKEPTGVFLLARDLRASWSHTDVPSGTGRWSACQRRCTSSKPGATGDAEGSSQRGLIGELLRTLPSIAVPSTADATTGLVRASSSHCQTRGTLGGTHQSPALAAFCSRTTATDTPEGNRLRTTLPGAHGLTHHWAEAETPPVWADPPAPAAPGRGESRPSDHACVRPVSSSACCFFRALQWSL